MKSKDKLYFALALLVLTGVVHADDIPWLQVDGNIRSYDFMKSFNKQGVNDQQAFALGGALNLLTKFKSPWQVGASFYTSQTLGLNSSDPSKVDMTLPGHTVNVIGQTFLQYQTAKWLLRMGNQLIDTPWINAADSRMIPATYEGVYGRGQLTDEISISALRVFRFKSRTSDSFDRSNLYNSENYGGTGVPQYGNTPNQGALAFNTSYKKNNLTMNAWYYRFYDFANLLYGDSRYQFATSNSIKPYFGAQGLREWGAGGNALMPYIPGAANSSGIGALLGAKINKLDASLGYNSIFKNQAAFKAGDILSPYTSGYSSDPLYTTSMGGGLVEKSAGQAYKASLRYDVVPQVTLGGSFAKYFTAPVLANSNETDLDATYRFANKLKGLSARYRFGLLNGTSTGRVIQSRIMLQYAF